MKAKRASFGLLVAATKNIGDDVQAFAASRFLPRIDHYVERESLSDFKSSQKVYVIFNGWFLHRQRKWPPAENIEPLFISFHISPIAKKALLSKKSLNYIERFQPIGTRDFYTLELLRKVGISAYFSGCLTLTLNKSELLLTSTGDAKNILLIDLDERTANAIKKKNIPEIRFETQILSNSSEVLPKFLKPLGRTLKKFLLPRHYHELQYLISGRSSLNYRTRLQLAKKRLVQIASAKLVITSRLHVALPSLALNTPVLFVPSDIEDPRFEGLKELLTTITPAELMRNLDGYIADPPTAPNPRTLFKLQESLRKRAKAFVENAINTPL